MDARLRKASSSSSRLVALEEGFPGEGGDGRFDRKIWRGNRVSSDSANMALLVLLYALQGVPLGLSSGSIPFILKERTSYTAIGLFSLAGYPYAMKLLWSPVVDTIFHPAIGWRKSWVLPIQTALGLLMIFSSSSAQIWMKQAQKLLNGDAVKYYMGRTTVPLSVMCYFDGFRKGWGNGLVGPVRHCQYSSDDNSLLFHRASGSHSGWALTLLSKQNIGHASTCQTVGMNIGYFLSFTIFLALNDARFCNHYLRRLPQDQGVLTLASYLVFWGWMSVIVALLLVFKHEHSPPSPTPLVGDLFEQKSYGKSAFYTQNQSYLPEYNAPDSCDRRQNIGHGGTENSYEGGPPRQIGVRQMYKRLWKVATLSHIRSLTTVLLLCKETVAMIVLLEFPLELCFAVFAGRWAGHGRPFSPWLAGYFLRLCTATFSTILVGIFPIGATIGSAPMFYAAIVATGLMTSFASTMMFVAQGTFFARISDSSMGGTYLTLLNTIANLGSAWPKFFVFMLIDRLTLQSCVGHPSGEDLFCPLTPSAATNPCTAAGGTCVKRVDGFFPLSTVMILFGAGIGLVYRKRLLMLESAKETSWRA